MAENIMFTCQTCRGTYPAAGLDYRCRCGGLFELEGSLVAGEPIDLGLVKTPVLKREFDSLEVHLKLDYMMPTGSFKDRGAAVLIGTLRTLGVGEVVEDSSGNAGAAIAAHAAAAGLGCRVFVPAATPDSKLVQIAAYGAEVVRIDGPRENAAQAARDAARETYYASHVFNPLFYSGISTMALEVRDQIGIPDWVVVPVGNGSLLLGLYLGFKSLGTLPPLIAIQSANCAPIYSRWHDQPPGVPGATAAGGIAIADPPRMEDILAAVKESGGDVVTVTEREIEDSRQRLGQMGVYVEPTAAVGAAGAVKCFPDPGQDILVPLTGSGLKK